MGLKKIIALLVLSVSAFAQQPQTSDVSGTQPLYPINAKYVNGVAPGYWPTAGSGLTLNLTAGTVWCIGTVRTYAGGTLTMTNSTTNYVYLDSASNCAPASSTSAFAGTNIPIAVVVASGGVITTITDDRSPLAAFSTSSLGGGAASLVRTCEIVIGDPGAASVALADDNDAPAECGNKTGATLTITAVECYADAGSPTVRPIITGGSSSSILSGALTCGTGSFASGSLSGTPTETNGQSIDGNIVTAGGTAKYIVIRITRTL